MEFECSICFDVDKEGKHFQCDHGHWFCESCYLEHVQTKRQQGVRAHCPTCREKLVNGYPVRALAVEQAIAHKKRATIAEVEQAEREANVLEVAQAAAAAFAHEAAAARADADASADLAAKLDVEEAERARQAALDAHASALAIARAEGDGDVEQQAKAAAEYEAKRQARHKRERTEQEANKYSVKLQRTLADAPADADQVGMRSSIIRALLRDMSPSDQRLVLDDVKARSDDSGG